MTGLPHIDEVAAAAEHCTHCPKLCRFACPVAEATGRESATPWGIDREIVAAHRDGAVNEATAAAAYACTGCRACGGACLPGLDLPTQVRAARAEIVDAGLAPAAAAEAAGAERRVGGALLDGATPGADLVVFPGCRSEDGDALAAVLSAAGHAWDVVREPVCCGARSADAGYAARAAAQGAHAVSQLAGAGRIVAMDPHCGRRLALELPGEGGDARLVTLPALLAELAGRLPIMAGGGPVVWHDPCWLGRGMGCYDAARAVVHTVTGQPAREPDFTRAHARCTGGGMGLDAIMSQAADAIAVRRAEELRAAGGDDLPVVTACPTAAARLAAAGLDAHDLAGWLASRLTGAALDTVGEDT